MQTPDMTINEAIDITILSYQRASWSIRLQFLLNISIWVVGVCFLYQSSLATDALDKANQNYDSNSPVKPNDLVSLIFSGLCDSYGDVYTLSTCNDIIVQRQKQFVLEFLGSLFIILGSFNLLQIWVFIKWNFNLELMRHYIYQNSYFPPTTQTIVYDNVPLANNPTPLPHDEDFSQPSIAHANEVYEIREDLYHENLNRNVDENLKKAIHSLKTKWFDLWTATFFNGWVLSMLVLDIASFVRFANFRTSSHVHTLFQDFCLSPYAGNTTSINNMSLDQWWSICENHGHYNTTAINTVPEKIAEYCEGICDAVSSNDYTNTNTLGVFLFFTSLTLSVPFFSLFLVFIIILYCSSDKIARLMCRPFFPNCYDGVSYNLAKIDKFIRDYKDAFFPTNVSNEEPIDVSNGHQP